MEVTSHFPKARWAAPTARGIKMVPMEGIEPPHPYEYQILSLARLPIPPHRHPDNQRLTLLNAGELDFATVIATVLPYEMHSNAKQSCFKFKFTSP